MTSYVILLCAIVEPQQTVAVNSISAQDFFKFIDHRGLSFYEYRVFSAVWNNSESILITLL